jgi:serralysin
LISFDSDGAMAQPATTIIDLDHVAPTGISWVQLTNPAPDPAAGQMLIAPLSGAALQGGVGPDTLTGLDGRNTLFGGDGDDRIVGGANFNQVNGNKGSDTIVGKSSVGDWLLGGQGDDQIDASGSSGHNIINGNIGNDTVTGGPGGCTLRGGQGDDTIVGGSGADWISGDRGTDFIHAGGGADTVHIAKGGGGDVVTDFHVLEGDRVQIDAGLTYSVSQLGPDLYIDFGDGDHLLLYNVTQVSLPPGWIFST